MYRVNYGNGQVSQAFGSRQAALAHIQQMDMYRQFASVQRRMDREWMFSGTWQPS